MSDSGVLPNFIIAGVGKAATTSVFYYLCAHPQICGASAKETEFFLNGYTGVREADIAFYSEYFRHCNHNADVVMEATPGYLAGGSEIAMRIYTVLPRVKLLCLLRDPIERLYSYYNYYRGKLFFKEDMSFDEYVDKCLLYSSRTVDPSALNLESRFLNALERGRYSGFLKEYYEVFPEELLKVMFYEHLRDDPRAFMADLCGFLGIDSAFYDHYDFYTVNASYLPKIASLHRVVLSTNKKFERYLRRIPRIKRRIGAVYKMVNRSDKKGMPGISEASRIKLEEYYRSSNRRLAEMMDGGKTPRWVS